MLEGDILLPSLELPKLDIRCLIEVSAIPVNLVVWRTTNATVANCRNSCFAPTIGVTIQSFAVDVMHCLHLGTWKSFFCVACGWFILLGDAWNTGATTQKQLLAVGFLKFRSELNAWYARERKRIGEDRVYAVNNFSLHMLRMLPTRRWPQRQRRQVRYLVFPPGNFNACRQSALEPKAWHCWLSAALFGTMASSSVLSMLPRLPSSIGRLQAFLRVQIGF